MNLGLLVNMALRLLRLGGDASAQDDQDEKRRQRARRTAGEVAADAEAAALASIRRIRPRCETCHGTGYCKGAVCGACGGTGDAVEAPQ